MFILAIQTNSPINSRVDVAEFLKSAIIGLLAGADSGCAVDDNGRAFAQFMLDEQVNPDVFAVDFRAGNAQPADSMQGPVS